MATSLARLRTVVRREGAAGTVRHATLRLRQRFYVKEAHKWYEWPIADAPVGDGVPEGMSLVRADAASAVIAEEMQGSPEEMADLLRAGHDLWIVRDGDRCAFSCWTFNHRTPVLAARGGWMELPDGAVCLEDSATDPGYRGRGIAPAAWRDIARKLRGEGARTIVTKIATDNVPSQKAVAKVGFREIGTMRLDRVLMRSRLEFANVVPAAPTMAALVESLLR